MARDRSRDVAQFKLYGLSAAMGSCFGAAYGVGVAGPEGLAGLVIGALVGVVMAPVLIVAVESSDHPMVLPSVFVPTVVVSFVLGAVSGEPSGWSFVAVCGVYLAACVTAGRVFAERELPVGRCRRCWYDLRGVSGAKCPECGGEEEPLIPR